MSLRWQYAWTIKKLEKHKQAVKLAVAIAAFALLAMVQLEMVVARAMQLPKEVVLGLEVLEPPK